MHAGCIVAFDQALHLVPGDSAAGLLIHAGARRSSVRRLDDLLTTGPCHPDPERHFPQRIAWHIEVWGRSRGKPMGEEDLRFAVKGDLPVVIWATEAYADLVWLWWVLAGLQRMAVDPRRFLLARPCPEDPLAAVGGCTLPQAQAALSLARPLSEAECRGGAALWTKFASPSPLAFDAARRRGSKLFPGLRERAELHGAWFPRAWAGCLRLSELDELLLRHVSAAWRTPSEIIAEMTGRERLLWPFGGLYSVWRLRQWALHTALEGEERENENPFERAVFRLTDTARRILSEGPRNVGEVPSLHVGGCRVNDEASPWVRMDDGAGWRIVLQKDAGGRQDRRAGGSETG